MVASFFYIFVAVLSALIMTAALKNIRDRLGLFLYGFVFLFIYGLAGIYSSITYISDISIYPAYDYRQDIYIVLGAITTLLSAVIGFVGYRCGNLCKVSGRGTQKYEIRYAHAMAFFLIGAMCMFVYVQQYGGFADALFFAAQIRSGVFVEDVGQLTLVKNFIPILIYPPLMILYLRIKNKNLYQGFAFFIATLTASFGFLLMAGRTRVVIFFMMMFFIHLCIKSKGKIRAKNFLPYVSIFAIIISVIVYGKQLVSSLSQADSVSEIRSVDVKAPEDIITSSVGYFSHRIYSTEIALKNFVEFNDLYGVNDYINIPLFFIPQRLTGIEKPDSINVHSSYQLTGLKETVTPPGMVAAGLYNAFLPGAFIVCLMFGFFFGVMDKVTSKAKDDYLVFAVPVQVYAALYFSLGDINVIVKAMTFLIVPVLYFSFIKVMRFNGKVLRVGR